MKTPMQLFLGFLSLFFFSIQKTLANHKNENFLTTQWPVISFITFHPHPSNGSNTNTCKTDGSFDGLQVKGFYGPPQTVRNLSASNACSNSVAVFTSSPSGSFRQVRPSPEGLCEVK